MCSSIPLRCRASACLGELSAGIRYFNRQGKVDVIVVTRGGGSFEDLLAFNDEALARVIAASEIPIISAVGHETDFTICDFVADLRAPTPSAAAELVIRSKHELAERLAGLHKRMRQAVNYKLLRAQNALSQMAQHAVFARMQDAIARRQQRADDLMFRMAQAQGRILKGCARRLEGYETGLRHHDPRMRLALLRRQLDGHTALLASSIERGLAVRSAGVDRLTSALGRAAREFPAAPAVALGAAAEQPAGAVSQGHPGAWLCPGFRPRGPPGKTGLPTQGRGAGPYSAGERTHVLVFTRSLKQSLK